MIRYTIYYAICTEGRNYNSLIEINNFVILSFNPLKQIPVAHEKSGSKKLVQHSTGYINQLIYMYMYSTVYVQYHILNISI